MDSDSSTTIQNTYPRVLVAGLLHLLLSGLFFVAIVVGYGDYTHPGGSQERFDPWPTRAATLGVLMLWLIVIPTVASGLALIFSLKRRPLLILALLVLLIATLPLLWFISAYNSCHTDIGFPIDTNC